MQSFEFDDRKAMGRGWNEARLLVRGKLTDKLIRKYQRLGFYSPEFKEARKAIMQKKQANRQKRTGNWVEQDGRLIYSPL